MTKEEARKISDEIKYDIQMGVYTNFSILEMKLLSISNKLVEFSYIENRELPPNSIKTLEENGYI
jgi:hypothetical protein